MFRPKQALLVFLKPRENRNKTLLWGNSLIPNPLSTEQTVPNIVGKHWYKAMARGLSGRKLKEIKCLPKASCARPVRVPLMCFYTSEEMFPTIGAIAGGIRLGGSGVGQRFERTALEKV